MQSSLYCAYSVTEGVLFHLSMLSWDSFLSFNSIYRSRNPTLMCINTTIVIWLYIWVCVPHFQWSMWQLPYKYMQYMASISFDVVAGPTQPNHTLLLCLGISPARAKTHCTVFYPSCDMHDSQYSTRLVRHCWFSTLLLQEECSWH